jgi:hypothetical protein
MGRSFVYFAVQKAPTFDLEVFKVSAVSATIFEWWVGRDVQQDRVDLDRSVLFDVGTEEAASEIEAMLHAEFFPFAWSNHLRTQGRFTWGKIKPDCSHSYVTTDQEAGDILDGFVRYVLDNRVRLGDEGDWQMQCLRDNILRRPWAFLSGQIDDAPPVSRTTPDYQTDHSDEVASFRLPSPSVLAGHAQPIGALKGQRGFEHLFVKDGTGVYVVFDGDDLLYVGMTQCFSQRLMNANAHHKLRIILERHPKAHVALIHYPVAKFAGLGNAVTSAEHDAAWSRIRELVFGLERACIGFYRPRYNGTLKGADNPLNQG